MTLLIDSAAAEQERLTIAECMKKKDIFGAVSALGGFLFSAFMAIVKVIVGGILWVIAALLRGIDRIKKPVSEFFGKIGSFLVSPFKRYHKALKMGSSEISKTSREKGAVKGFFTWLKVTGRIIFGKRGLAVTIVNWALPVVSCIFLFNIISYANNQTYALKLTVNGDLIGYIDDETVFTDAEKMVQKRINYVGSHTEVVNFEPSYEVDMIGYGSTLNQYQLADKLLEQMDAEIEHGYGLYIGDVYYGTLTAHDDVDEALENLLDDYRTGDEKETVSFDREIVYTPGLYLADSFVSEEAVIEQLTSKKQVASYYTVVEGDAPSIVCSKVDMTYEELQMLNPDFGPESNLQVGEQIKITQDEPFLTIMVTREEHYSENVNYETEYIDDNTVYSGNKVIEKAGEYGERAVTANVSYINGTEVSRRVLSRETTKQPVTEIIAVGTKPRPADAAPGTTIGEGKMLWPVGGDGGSVSELPYGYGGYYGHNGIDIMADYGTPIYAAENGTVIFCEYGWNGGYGNFIKIQGDSGYTTYYGHCSELATYTGAQVTQGDLIGYVGQTGRAYGNHLHFEVRIGDYVLFPLDYLPGY